MPKTTKRKMGDKMPGKAMPKKRSSSQAQAMDNVVAGLRCVIDPHTNINVYDMGLISELKKSKNGISMVFRPTSPFCPLAFDLARSMKGKIWEVDGPTLVDVKVVGHYQEDNINKALKSLDPTAGKKKSRKSR